MNDIAAIRRLLEVLVLIALFVTAYFAKDLLLPILLGFLLALTLSPLIRSFEKFGISPPLGAVLLIGFVGLIIFVWPGCRRAPWPRGRMKSPQWAMRYSASCKAG